MSVTIAITVTQTFYINSGTLQDDNCLQLITIMSDLVKTYLKYLPKRKQKTRTPFLNKSVKHLMISTFQQRHSSKTIGNFMQRMIRNQNQLLHMFQIVNAMIGQYIDNNNKSNQDNYSDYSKQIRLVVRLNNSREGKRTLGSFILIV